jgi:hypothetical protein
MGPENPRKRASRQRVLEKHPTTQLIRRRGLAPVAYLCEAAWNLREWLREVDDDHSLHIVLMAMLPKIRRRIELSLLDAELSRFAPSLPNSRSATAANLVAFIEGLELPGKIRILPPPGKPPLQWIPLARARALKIAMQLCKEDGTLVYDPKSESDLKAIEQLDDRLLVRIWRAAERVQPLRQLEGDDTEMAPPESDNADLAQLNLKPQEKRALEIIRQDGPDSRQGFGKETRFGGINGSSTYHSSAQRLRRTK